MGRAPLKGCFDSDVVIDILQGIPAAVEEFSRYDQRHISTVTWVEVLTGAIRQGIANDVRAFLATFSVHDLDRAIGDRAAELRISHRLKTPDAIIWATALASDVPLVTRNTRDFPANDPTVRVPYEL